MIESSLYEITRSSPRAVGKAGQNSNKFPMLIVFLIAAASSTGIDDD
jgi:hypothetical protein